MLTAAHTRRRRPSASRRSRNRGFTLIETAISGIVIAGITASLLVAMRYSQMVSEGKAVGQQMTAISEGVNRYMKQYSKQILALDARCAESTLEIDEGGPKPSGPTGTEPDCKLVLGSVTVANGFQPTVKELQDLELVRANDALMLPFSPGITVDKRTGEAAVARIAVAIRPVRHPSTPGNPTSVASTGASSSAVIPAGFVPGINHRLAGPVLTFYDFQFKVGTDADRDLPPTINGVSCYSGTVGDFAGGQKTERVVLDPKDDLKVIPAYTIQDIDAAERAYAYRFASSGRMYCRYLQQRYGMGLVGSSPAGDATGTGGGHGDGTADTWTLESVVFNTQPYYFGTNNLPLGAAAQMGAALQEAGYTGRMSMPKTGMAESRTLRGLFGHSQAENPIRSKDGARGLPGVLAAVSLLADHTQAASASGSTAAGWDTAGGDITSTGLIQGKQIAANTAVFGNKDGMLNSRGRDATLAVNGNMVMGRDSVLMAAKVEADGVDVGVAKARSVDAAEHLSTPGMQVAAQSSRVGHLNFKPYNFYLRDGTRVRLPRVEIGKPCEAYGDIGVTRGVSIQRPNGNIMEVTRFLALCKPDQGLSSLTNSDSIAMYRTSTWSSPEYDALLKKYPTGQYNWYWFASSNADVNGLEPAL